MKLKFSSICLLNIVFVLGSLPVLSQNNGDFKIGKISEEDFKISSPDSSAAALIIGDIGSSEFGVGSYKGIETNIMAFALNYTRKKRVKLINKNGFDEATVEIPLYTDAKGREEKLTGLKAYTYNLENGKIEKIQLESKDVFTEKKSKHWIIKKFTFPGLKEGSIIEYTYTINSDFISHLRSWNFQSIYPCLWSEYEVAIPEYFKYLINHKGFLPFTVNKEKQTSKSFTFQVKLDNGENLVTRTQQARTEVLTPSVTQYQWVLKDIPAIKLESYTSTVWNYLQQVEFQLSSIQYPNSVPRNYLQTWEEATVYLMNDEDFGQPLSQSNSWMNDELKSITAGKTSSLEKAKSIYEYINKNFVCSGRNSLYRSQSLKDIMKNKSGNNADINLLLAAMLRNENLTAYPVILSTTDNGYVTSAFPVLDQFNYVVCQLTIDNKTYYLDAAIKDLPFGYLNWNCYNGYARVINPSNPESVLLVPDALVDSRSVSVFIYNNDKGQLEGSYSMNPGIYSSLHAKRMIQEKGKDFYFNKLRYEGEVNMTISNPVIETVDAEQGLISAGYDFIMDFSQQDDLVYFLPLLDTGLRKNPFTSADRNYPVEMPYCTDFIYTLNMEIPRDYTLEEMPKPVKTSLNDGEANFEYKIGLNGESIQLQFKLVFKRATFEADDYKSLREFMTFVVNKQNEPIVFKKKK